ncbi:hypothetical protein GCM10009740_39190 [Terrabacter terrae]|uniref:WD40 repeat protein n=1 Tax=Terrabacter terrae TaxID=318434 RepID=A0ABP4KI72_9MICO
MGALVVVTLVASALAACTGATSAATTTSPPATASLARPTSAAATPSTSSRSALPPSGPATGGAPLVKQTAYVLGNVQGHLRMVHPDGTGGRILVPSVDVLGESNGVIVGDWSPDGRRVAFTRVHRDVQPFTASQWVAMSDGSGAREVVPCAPPCLRAGLGAFSPRGDQLAYAITELDAAGTRVTRNAVEVVTLATGRRRVVAETREPLVEFAFPRWSPDGRRLVVQVTHWPAGAAPATAPVSGSPRIAVLDLARPKTQVPRVLAPGLPGTYPDWSRKTDTIVFSTNDPDVVNGDVEHDLWTVRPDGTRLRQVTHLQQPALAMHPTWTPDGTILFEHCAAMPACYLAYASADGSVVQTPQDLQAVWPRAKPGS